MASDIATVTDMGMGMDMDMDMDTGTGMDIMRSRLRKAGGSGLRRGCWDR